MVAIIRTGVLLHDGLLWADLLICVPVSLQTFGGGYWLCLLLMLAVTTSVNPTCLC
jgi:hypothetical protein